MLRRIPLGNMYNLRDLGGYSAARRITAFERFLRGDVPAQLTEADLDWLRVRGITTVIDLRSGGEIERNPDQLATTPGFCYHNIPLVGVDHLPELEEDMGLAYFMGLDRKESIRATFEVIGQATGGVLYHCAAGKDRTGLLSALLLSLADVDRMDILADYEVSETYLWELVTHLRRAKPELPAFWGCSKREYMADCLRRLNEKYGSAPDYLKAIGLGDGLLADIKAKLVGAG